MRSPAPALVVDDHAPMRQLAAIVLSRHLGVEVVAAADGEEALRLVADRRPMLILTDMMMPGLGGADLTRRLRADPATRDIPIIAMSGGPHAVEARAAGCDAFLGKPFSPRQLVEAVDRALGRPPVAEEHPQPSSDERGTRPTSG
jgi:CheY-like chemotaxis protein